MRAAVFEAAGKPLEIRSVDDPKPGEGELVLRVTGCGICGSDLHVTESPGGIPSGIVLGHEFAGEVVELGAGVSGSHDWKVGDLVCSLPAIGCGRCADCLTGDLMGCSRLRATGFGEIGGAYAEYVLVGANETLRLPRGLAPADGALVEPLAVGLHAVEMARLAHGDDVLVVGAGPVGLAVALWARHFGARNVVVSDFVAGRREMAAGMGATAVVDPNAEDLRAAFERETGNPPALVFECVGAPGLIQQCIDVAPRGGRILVAGMCLKPDTIVPVSAMLKQLQFQFVAYYRRQDFALTLDMLGAGRIDPQPMVTQRIGLDALPGAFEALRTPVDQCKVIVQP